VSLECYRVAGFLGDLCAVLATILNLDSGFLKKKKKKKRGFCALFNLVWGLGCVCIDEEWTIRELYSGPFSRPHLFKTL